MEADELRQAMALGREQRGVEFKGPGRRTEKPFLAKVIRAVLGMANKPDGGHVIIGVEDTGSSLIPRGLSEAELATWSYDDLASSISNYADPYVDFDSNTVIIDGASFIAVRVKQFDSFPVICKRDLQPDLRNGALYVRRRGRIETTDVPSHVEMREVLQRAADILARDKVASYLRLRERVDVQDDTHISSDKQFDAQAEDLL